MTKTYNSKIPAYNLIMTALDLLHDTAKFETLLVNISDEERTALYDHPLLNNADNTHNEIGENLLP